MQDDINTLAPQPERLVIAGKDIDILPVKVGQLPRLLAAIKPILAELTAGDMMAALSAQPDQSLEAIAILCGQPRTWLDDLDMDDLVKLAGVCLEVNADFFVRRLAPAIQTASQRLTPIMAGLTLPNGSSPTGTGTAT